MLAATLAPWQDPSVNSQNRLPARELVVPCETEDLAIGIARGEKRKTESRWVIDLNGEWDFKWKRESGRDWEKSAKIKVPSCWQLQGDYDPPLYVNATYPIAFDGSGDPMKEPPKEYTSYEYRNPVGLYTTTFKRPWRWWFRRTVIRFAGVSSAFYVRVNGKVAGYSEDSRLPAEFDISPYLKWFGVNKIEVEVYKHCDGTYLEDQDFWRLSGIFRDVMLVSEHPKAPRNLVVDTWLSDDYTQGRFIVRDEKGNDLKVREVPEPKLWNAEFPCVYVTPLEHKWGWWIFGGTDHYAVSLGFRKVEIRDSVIYLNGKRVLFKGVNRHEMDPETGYTITVDKMRRDIRRMRDFNINAVRTCHYPDVPEWYDLCDRDGLMVVCEANIESHGAGYGEKTLATKPAWKKSHVERGERMVGFFRNHPSILIWSLGNEAGDGENFAAEYKAIRALNPTRPIQYERAGNGPNTDIYCPMYARPANCERYVSSSPAKPMVLCEYAHAMGNSNGGVSEYWDLVRKYPSFQGGFVWDFADQALWKASSDGTRTLAYGGDFGDVPNDGNFNCNGMFDALRNPHPGAYEVKHAYRNIRVDSLEGGVAKVRNGFVFRKADGISGEWTLSSDGKAVRSGKFALDGLEAGAVQEVNLGDLSGEGELFATFRFFEKGAEIACDQFKVGGSFAPKAAGKGSAKFVTSEITPNFWRAPIDNDRGNNMPNRLKVWKDATNGKLPDGCKADVKREALPNGGERVTFSFHAAEKLPDIPRVGVTFTIPKDFTRVRWYGCGPHENYSDRRTGAMVGVYSATVGLVSGVADAKDLMIEYPADRLNPDNYIEPGEQGYRCGVRWVEFSNGKDSIRISSAQEFGFNAWPYSQKKLEAAKHQWDLVADDSITVNIDAAQMGVGGDDSWGAQPHDPYKLQSGRDYSLTFDIE